MGVYIKGMEMPKDGCKDCMLVKRGNVFDICPFLKREVNGNVERGGKPYGCPLVPVPPHGRLIDADALAKLDRMVGKLMMYGGEYVYTQAEIDRAPTIIEAEEGE